MEMADSTFLDLLQRLTSPAGDIRREAEAQYNSAKVSSPHDLLFSLLQSVAGAAESSLGQLSCVLLRRLLVEEKDDVLSKLNPDNRKKFLDALLALLGGAVDCSLKLKVASIASELAGFILEPEECPEIARLAVDQAQSSEDDAREMGLTMLGSLTAAALVSAGINSDQLIQLLSQTFQDTRADGKFVLLSMQALDSVLQSMSSEAETDVFCPLVPVLLGGLNALFQLLRAQTQAYTSTTSTSSSTAAAAGDAQAAADALARGIERAEATEVLICSFLESMIEIAEDKPLFFATTIALYIEPMACVVETPREQLAAPVRFLALEFLVTVCCAATKRVRKFKGPQGDTKGYFAARIIPICVKMMTDLDSEGEDGTESGTGSGISNEGNFSGPENDAADAKLKEWLTAVTLEVEDAKNSAASAGESALNRCCAALGAKATYATVSAVIGPFLMSPQWEQQHAAIATIASYLEISAQIADRAQLQLHRSEVAATLLLFADNAHPRVRAAAFYAMSQLLINHGAALSEDQLDRLLSKLASHLPSAAEAAPRVRQKVLTALVSLLEISPVDYVEHRVGQLLERIAAAMHEGPLIVQEVCVSAVMSIAETVKGAEVWRAHYGALMPLLQQLLHYAQQLQQEALWAQTLECCALVGEAAGRELFYNDAIDLMNALLAMQEQQQIKQDSDADIGLMKAWVRVARSLGSDFLPYLPMIMHKLFNALSQDVTVPLESADDARELEERSDIEMVETDTQGWIAVRTAAVEEQSSACQMVILLAERLQEHFYPYVEQCVQLLAKLLNSPHDDIRGYALVALPELVRATGRATAAAETSATTLAVGARGGDGCGVGGGEKDADAVEALRSRQPLEELAVFVIGLLVHSVETEAALELIMGGLQAIKHVLHYACTDWVATAAATSATEGASAALLGSIGVLSNAGGAGAGAVGSVPTTGTNTVPILSLTQMESLTRCAKTVMRDSLQRRAVLTAEAQVSGPRDEDDADEEKLFLRESQELHLCIADMLGTVFRTHGAGFYGVYQEQWGELVQTVSHPYCIEADRQFAFHLLSDVFEFGLNKHSARLCFESMLPTIIESCKSCPEVGLRRTCAYAIGVACEKNPEAFAPYAASALQALGTCVALGDVADDSNDEQPSTASASVGGATYATGASGGGESGGSNDSSKGNSGSGGGKRVARGECTDNAVAAVGTVLEQMQLLGVDLQLNQQFMWEQWLNYLPLRADVEEGVKVIGQLLRLLRQRFAHLLAPEAHFMQSLRILTEVIDSDLVSQQTSHEALSQLRSLCGCGHGAGGGGGTLQRELLNKVASALPEPHYLKMEQLLLASWQPGGTRTGTGIGIGMRGALAGTNDGQAAGLPPRGFHSSSSRASTSPGGASTTNSAATGTANGGTNNQVQHVLPAQQQQAPMYSSSPLATAPIHDILMMRK